MTTPTEGTKPALPTPRAWASFAGFSSTKHVVELRIGRDWVLFYGSAPIGIIHPGLDGATGILFFPDRAWEAHATRAMRAFAAKHNASAEVRTSASNFDYILAQTLICTALPWTRAEELYAIR